MCHILEAPNGSGRRRYWAGLLPDAPEESVPPIRSGTPCVASLRLPVRQRTLSPWSGRCRRRTDDCDMIGRMTVLRAAWIAGLAGTVGPTAFAIADLLISDPIDARTYRWLWDMLERLAPIVWPSQLLMLIT